MNGILLTQPIPDREWDGLAGALKFENGDRPWFYVTSDEDHEITVCAGLESVEIHHVWDPENIRTESFQLAHAPLTSLAGRCLAEGMAQALASGLNPTVVAEKFGMEKIA